MPARLLRAARGLILYRCRQRDHLTRDLRDGNRHHLIRHQRLQNRSLRRIILIILERNDDVIVALLSRIISRIDVRSNRTAHNRFLLRSKRTQRIRLAVRRRGEMTLILNDDSVTVLLILIDNVRVSNITILVNLYILSDDNMFIVYRRLTVSILRRNRILDAIMRILLYRRAVISRRLRQNPLLLVFHTIVLRCYL